MVNLSLFYNLSVYNTEGKYIGKVNEVVLNIKKGKISLLKTKALKADKKNVGLKDVLKSVKLVPDEEEEITTVHEEGIIDIPYEIVTAVGDIILIDQNRLSQVRVHQTPQQRPKTQTMPQSRKQKIPTNN